MTLKYFKHSEFDCPTLEGSGQMMNYQFLEKLDDARGLAEIPFVITSGYRTKDYNEDLIRRKYKASRNSSHLKGLAADIKCNTSRNRWIIINSLVLAGFSRIGVADTFIHVDLDLDKAQNVIWTY
ncbi:MAG: putative peptidase M15 [Prokaryotic dsDNA virus sp.]|nr:MAG: putative peptidase M15 [Prokaryotic dsDNA virus sp.]|tara:strand:- start:1775 stop:2149 length:375 start_codon:yes stop_codon:yes gene_type:complete